MHTRGMQQISEEDAQRLWDENSGKNWEELQLLLKEYRDRFPELDDEAIGRLIAEIDFLKSRKAYPESAGELRHLLSERFP